MGITVQHDINIKVTVTYMYVSSVSDFGLNIELYMKYIRGRLRSYFGRTKYIDQACR